MLSLLFDNCGKKCKIFLRGENIFIDTHAHLTDKAFDGDLDSVLENCLQQGVLGVITSGFNLPSSFDALSLAKKYNYIYASVGVYPENIYELNEEAMQTLFSLGREEKSVCIGEIGLQYTEGMPDRENQKKGFVRQLALANELGKPIVIHCRDAYGDMVEILRQNKNLLQSGGTMHCFGGSFEVAKELIKLGFYISVGGVSTFKNATALRQCLKKIPLEKMLLETDCPYLAPHPFRGKRNSPALVPVIAENLAALKGIEKEEVERVTTLNARRLFGI